jgi:hypothetical protein
MTDGLICFLTVLSLGTDLSSYGPELPVLLALSGEAELARSDGAWSACRPSFVLGLESRKTVPVPKPTQGRARRGASFCLP